MTSFRNVIKRKTHKERSQPVERKKYGLLEKKKDWKLRTIDAHRKEDKLKILQRKAEQKNPDEFYFAMENSHTKNGVHVKERTVANKYTAKELLFMKTQDVQYVLVKAQIMGKKIAKLQESLHMIPQATNQGDEVEGSDDEDVDMEKNVRSRGSNHVRFESDAESEEDVSDDDVIQYADSDNEGITESAEFRDEDDGSDDEENADVSEDDNVSDDDVDPKIALQQKLIRKRRASAYRKLKEYKRVYARLMSMVQHMTIKKELMKRGGVKKSMTQNGSGENQAVYKWKLMRKR